MVWNEEPHHQIELHHTNLFDFLVPCLAIQLACLEQQDREQLGVQELGVEYLPQAHDPQSHNHLLWLCGRSAGSDPHDNAL